MDELAGKRAFVLGGSRGIGAAIVRSLAQRGAALSFSYLRSLGAADALAREVGGRFVQVDSADREAVISAVRAEGAIDVLVVSAGVTVVGNPLELDMSEIDRMIDVNLRAPYFATVEAARTMPDDGRVIIIGSAMADVQPFPGLAAYSATKSALRGMVRGFARDFGRRSITVNVVEPGPVDTDSNPADSEMAAAVVTTMPLQRYIKPAEIGDFVAYLAGPAAKSITGAAHRIDAGFGI